MAKDSERPEVLCVMRGFPFQFGLSVQDIVCGNGVAV
jgi:hypothetical protein